jgi:hypothetical protein
LSQSLGADPRDWGEDVHGGLRRPGAGSVRSIEVSHGWVQIAVFPMKSRPAALQKRLSARIVAFDKLPVSVLAFLL